VNIVWKQTTSINYFYLLEDTNVENFEILSGKICVVGICDSIGLTVSL
jgi:hypothetical protein